MEPGSDEIGVITLPGRGAATARYLQSRIFFQDRVMVTDASAEWAQFEVFGPAAGTILGNLPAPDSVIAAEIGGAAVRVIGLRDDAYGLITPVGQGEALAVRLIEAGAVLLSAEVYEVLRVEAGRPGPAQELTGEHTPLEANLDGAISSTKGCYSGQEIIARQLTYDKVARRMAGLRLEQPVAVGAAVQVDGRTVGTVTSAVQSPRFGPIALAVMRRPHFEPHTYVTAVPDDTRAVAGETVSLPFGQPR
jgi:folate-binding protein YgfZ